MHACGRKRLFSTHVMQESGLSSVGVMFERKCHESCIHQLSFFLSVCLTVPLPTAVCIRKGAEQELNLSTFFGSKHKLTNHMLLKYRRPMRWLPPQSALCHAAIADQYRKNQSHRGTLGTVVILCTLSNVCTSINADSFKYFLRAGEFRAALFQRSVYCTLRGH